MTTTVINYGELTYQQQTVLSEMYSFQFRHSAMAQAALDPRYVQVMSGKGQTARFNNYSGLNAATSARTQGADLVRTLPTEATATAVVYGYHAGVTEDQQTTAMAAASLLDQYRGDLGQLAQEQFDLLALTAMAAGVASANKSYGGSVTKVGDLAATDVITGAKVRSAVLKLRAAKVPGFTNNVDGAPCYYGFITPAVAEDLRSESGGQWITTKTGNPDLNWELASIGTAHGVRWFESPSAGLYAADGKSSAVVGRTIIFGKGALGAACADIPGVSGAADVAVAPAGLSSRCQIVRLTQPLSNAGLYRHADLISFLGFCVPRDTAEAVIYTGSAGF